MRRFFTEPKKFELNETIIISGDEFHHLKDVSRLEEGERIELLNSLGQIATAKIITIGRKTADVCVDEMRDVPPAPLPRVEVILCIPRFQKFDLILQKCAELGAEKIAPVISDRSFVKTLSKDLAGKKKRWEKIALEASKQSGRAWPMLIENPGSLKEYIGTANPSESLFLYEGEATLDIKTALHKIKKPERLKLFIGAEGGFSVQEVELFEKHGFEAVTLGALVLRVETACITLLSIIQYHFDLMRKP